VSEANERRGMSSVSQAPVARVAQDERGGQVEQGPCFKGVFRASRSTRVRLRTAHTRWLLNQGGKHAERIAGTGVIERTATAVVATVVLVAEQLKCVPLG
jgi:hypothetical protein